MPLNNHTSFKLSQKHSVSSRTKSGPGWHDFPIISPFRCCLRFPCELRTCQSQLTLCLCAQIGCKQFEICCSHNIVQQEAAIVHTQHVISDCLCCVKLSICADLTVPSRFLPFPHGSCPFSHGSVTVPV